MSKDGSDDTFTALENKETMAAMLYIVKHYSIYKNNALNNIVRHYGKQSKLVIRDTAIATETHNLKAIMEG
jgi:hypothetical protein